MPRQKSPKTPKNVTISNEPSLPDLGRYFSTFGHSPGTRENYEALAGPLHLNALVGIGLRWIGDNATQPKLVIDRAKGKARGRIKEDHGMLDLVSRPNPYYGWSELLKATAVNDTCDGNAYLLKVRDGNRRPAEVYWLDAPSMTPISEDGDFISYYEYRPPWARVARYYLPQDIVHIRNGLDLRDPRKGCSPLKSLSREIFSDNAASTYTAGILRNMGAYAFIVSPKDQKMVATPQTKADFKKDASRATGDEAGNQLFSNVALDVNKIGMSPEDMALDKIRHYPEDRILSAMGLNSTALNLTSGAGTKTFSNFGESIRQCYEGCLMPFLSRVSSALQDQLMPEFGSTDGLSLRYDYSQVAALREDQTMLVNRMLSLFTASAIDRAELRDKLGFEVDIKRDKGFFYGGTSIETPDRPEQEG